MSGVVSMSLERQGGKDVWWKLMLDSEAALNYCTCSAAVEIPESLVLFSLKASLNLYKDL